MDMAVGATTVHPSLEVVHNATDDPAAVVAHVARLSVDNFAGVVGKGMNLFSPTAETTAVTAQTTHPIAMREERHG